MSFFMRLINMFLRMIGMGGVARLNTDIHRINATLTSGGSAQDNSAAALAQAQAMTGNAAAGGYGGGANQAAMANNAAAWNAGLNPYANQAAQNAMVQQAMVGAQAQHNASVNAAVAANPALMAPIEGVTIEQYAGLCASAAQNQAPGAFEHLLAQHGMDRAKYDRVAAGWNARMRDDTTFALTTIYGRAFGGAGAGQFGAAGAAGAGSLAATGAMGMGQGVAAAEPVSWEKYNEIGGAQRAWSQSGKDVNAMLQKTFGCSALDWSNMSQFWMARMMTDPQKMMEMNTLQEQWAARYATPKADGDLTF